MKPECRKIAIYRTRPYDGWVIVSAWHAEMLPGTAQESRISCPPARHWGEAPCASNSNFSIP